MSINTIKPVELKFEDIQKMQVDKKSGHIEKINVDPRHVGQIINFLGLHKEQGLGNLGFSVDSEGSSGDSKFLFALLKEKNVRHINIARIFYGLVQKKLTPAKDDNLIHVTMKQLLEIGKSYKEAFNRALHTFLKNRKQDVFFAPQVPVPVSVSLPNAKAPVAPLNTGKIENKILVSSEIDDYQMEPVLRVLAKIPEKETGVPESLVKEFLAETQFLGGTANG